MSDADVESYKQIKSDLDVLRQSVEKSELWVYKSNKPTTATVAAGNQPHHGVNDEHQHQQQTLSSATNQVHTTSENVTPVRDTLLTAATTSSQPKESIVTDSTTTVPPIKENGNSSTTNDGEDGEIEDEDDEYKKIQKAS